VRPIFSSRRQELRSIFDRTRNVVLSSALIGVVTGSAVAGLERVTVELCFAAVDGLPLALAAFAPAIGLAAAAWWLRVPGRGLPPTTADAYLEAFHTGTRLRLPDMLHRIVASVATIGSGGALGLEGPSIYLGAALGSSAQARFRRLLPGADRNLLLVAGAAAGVAAIFKAPATGAVFAIEVPYQDDLARRMLLPALVAGASGYLAFAVVNGTDPLFPVHGTPPFELVDLAGAAALGVAAGFGARLFAWMLRTAKRRAAASHPALRVALAGAALAALFAGSRGLTGESLTLGTGYQAIAWAVAPDRSVPLLLAVLALRCLATTATVAGGGAGGLFVPLVVAGALLGRAVGGALHELDTTLFLVIGIAAVLGAGYRVPLAAVMFVAETTGRPGFVVPGLIAAVAAELVMLRSSVTELQAHPQPGGEARSGDAPG
jgi:CIC family chloride channel protein